jgi:uncharacterized membrane protein YdjX (TVP38/TMEM64 family)
LVALVVVLLLVGSSDTLHQTVSGWLERAGALISAHRAAGAGLFILLSAASAMLAFFSSTVLLPAALEVWSEGECLVMLWLGWIVGGIASYGIARSLGRPVVGKLAAPRTLARYEKIAGSASFGLLLLFQLAVPSELPGYLFGVARYPFWKYLAALALAELPYVVAAVYASSFFLSRQLVPLLILVVLAATLGVGTFQVIKRRLSDHGLMDRRPAEG